jgi:hypothetical protein
VGASGQNEEAQALIFIEKRLVWGLSSNKRRTSVTATKGILGILADLEAGAVKQKNTT